ncbi:MAG: hypothetical protein COU35_03295 [Candidatus Magasanikbacteria bacterium CG10_big_fil_rev_8_21_14_0_10_47_10]|uniref:Uncharacterized protein n=1 Tax=Candidatus Magasanikbacteria bacterium CG10_big_fil_rev_8_21_14_0_10_47_10 TaxID=1974652 RepID=A0A2H0TQ73_9BACT|nr:MAG: hypothetical protein COU35_03295 [Candidatus Magasanikbacteria bacterium CG10_big_fil_rev_8_21_14_0_10_47_10]
MSDRFKIGLVALALFVLALWIWDSRRQRRKEMRRVERFRPRVLDAQRPARQPISLAQTPAPEVRLMEMYAGWEILGPDRARRCETGEQIEPVPGREFLLALLDMDGLPWPPMPKTDIRPAIDRADRLLGYTPGNWTEFDAADRSTEEAV